MASQKSADAVGTLRAVNASCWFVAVDAMLALDWTGVDDESDVDFERALSVGEGPIDIGAGQGVLASVGECGCSKLYHDGESWCLLDMTPHEGFEPQAQSSLPVLCSRVAQLPTQEEQIIGEFSVECGAMVLALPYVSRPFSEDLVLSSVKLTQIKSLADEDALLVPVPNGQYAITYERLSHEDEFGAFYTRVRIARAKGS